MLAKLAFVMQRLKKFFFTINKDGGGTFWILWEDTAVMRGTELMGPTSPPTRENPARNGSFWKK